MNRPILTPCQTLLLFLLFFSTQLRAGSYLYDADVKGMVCAFCAYSVSKNISQLPGVDADSVDVDLKGGHVHFIASEPVDEIKLSALFSGSGFTISKLRQSEVVSAGSRPESVELELEMDRNKIEKYSAVLEIIGTVAAGNQTRLLIEATAADEDRLLKPILMGRQQVIKVRFSSTTGDRVVIKSMAKES